MHKLDDRTLITPTLLRRFEEESPDGRFYAFVQKDDSSFLSHNIGPEISADRTLFAQDVLTFLNRELHCNGAWVICFSNPTQPDLAIMNKWDYERFALIFLDCDGDPQFTVEWEANDGDLLDFADVLMFGMEGWGEMCHSALETQNYLMKDVLDPQEGETFRRAAGERPHSLH